MKNSQNCGKKGNGNLLCEQRNKLKKGVQVRGSLEWSLKSTKEDKVVVQIIICGISQAWWYMPESQHWGG